MQGKFMQWNIEKADAYGGVLLSQSGKILLREPTNHFDGYVWTFAKGKPRVGGHLKKQRCEVKEECGYDGNCGRTARNLQKRIK